MREYQPPPKGGMDDKTTKKNIDGVKNEDRKYSVFFLYLSSISTMCIVTLMICWFVYTIIK
ncbi:hypothetical protein PMSM_08330 [Paenibacillus macquariensis subsp. macquariensis]|uniref:Uncharacterized protein n=1 Tax=Paenibacillus macquariensis TaxID=948756 RepID=A0ABY1JTD1_9BACL|nr:hypothetical protein PMSM_08330 [Paenibacillus macquariensis subsp. macquariensis]SIQ72399.1 hypothetical protein SAMN05421578_103554 [Paenibacillus macquariensis]